MGLEQREREQEQGIDQGPQPVRAAEQPLEQRDGSFRAGPLPAVQQPKLEGGKQSASEQAYAAAPPQVQDGRNYEAETQGVLAYIREQARAKAAQPQHISKDSMLYKRLEGHYLKDYLANPNAQSGKAAVDKLSEQTDAATANASDDYWEQNAVHWNEHKVPDSIKLLSPTAPSSMGAATKVMSKENRAQLPYLDVPQMVGNPNTDTGADADVHGGGKNISQLMHWATGIKYNQEDPQGMRDMFLAYEYYHLEGFDKFGEDSINDMISEDAGRIMGRQLQAGEINQGNFANKLDEGFNESRAWVGKMIKMRQGELDAVITSKEVVQSEMWYGAIPGQVQHWGPSTIYLDLKNGMTVDQVKASHTVEHFIDIYALIYYSELWERQQQRRIQISNFQKSILAGKYNKVFEKSVKNEPLTGKEKMDAYMNARAPWMPGFARDVIRKGFGKKLGLEDPQPEGAAQDGGQPAASSRSKEKKPENEAEHQ